MGGRSDTINATMSGEELRTSWQGRALAFADGGRNFQLRTALISLLADNYDEALPFLLAAVFGEWHIKAPFYCSNPKIDKYGAVIADIIMPDGYKYKGSIIFANTHQMETIFRRLADKLKFSDAERIDLFVAIRHWIKADQRFDPTFDRRDPDARRLTIN